MKFVPVLLSLALAWPGVGSKIKIPRSSQAKDVIDADDEDVNPADLGAVQGYLQELEADHHAEKAVKTKKPFKISHELLEALMQPSPSHAPALRSQRSSSAPLLDELPKEDNSIDEALTKLGLDTGNYQPSVAVEGTKTMGTAKEADMARVTDKETNDLLRVVSQASAQPEAKSGAGTTDIENQLERLMYKEEEKDAEVIAQYIKQSNEDGLQQKIRSMSEHGGKARIHAAAVAMQAMGYTDDLVNKLMAGKGPKADVSQAEKGPEAEISKDIKETGTSSADDAKILFRLLKHHEQQELRNAVSTLFHYGGLERVKRAQSVLDMWLHKHATLPVPAKLASASPQLPSSPKSPLVGAASEAKAEQIEKSPPSVQAVVPKSEEGEVDQFAELNEELAKADASEMFKFVNNKDTNGMYAFVTELRRSVGGAKRLKLAQKEFDRQMFAAQEQKQQGSREEVALKSAKAAGTAAHQGQEPASAQTPVPSKPFPKKNAKAEIADIVHEQSKLPEKSVTHTNLDRQAEIDATIMMKYMKNHNKKALTGVLGELFALGGIERVKAAQAVVKRQTQQPSEGQNAVREQSAKVALSVQAHQDEEVTRSPQEQAQADAKMLASYAEHNDNAGLQRLYTLMGKTGLQRVRAAEKLAESMTESSRTQQPTPATASFASQAHQDGEVTKLLPEQAKADAEKLVSYMHKNDIKGEERLYADMRKTGPKRVQAAEALAESMAESSRTQQPTPATVSFASQAHQDGEVTKLLPDQAKLDAEKLVSYVHKKDFDGLQRLYADMRKTGPERLRAAEAIAMGSGTQQPTPATASFALQAHRAGDGTRLFLEQAKLDAEKMVRYFKKKDFKELERLYTEMRKTGPDRTHAAEALAERIAG